MRWYLDASIALHALLPGGDVRVRRWLEAARRDGEEVFSSTLLHLELTRVLRREMLDPVMARPLLDRIDQVSIDDGVLRFAAAIEHHVKSLDAIHLATCSLLGAGVTVVTHDAGMVAAAQSLGLDVFDPLDA
ncbi:MAG: type II toxin-antitoxin system VapC family toxin [Pseudoxanthomonas sp.]